MEQGVTLLTLRLVILLAALVLPRTADALELRLGTLNVHDGVGAPGTPKHEAILETVRRLRLDVIAFQEVAAQNRNPSHAEHFGHLKSLLQALGFATTRAHLALSDDAFATATYVAGDFGPTTQSLALASRYPITRTVQIGRGTVDGRKEVTRYPLLAEVDVPGTEHDPVFVVTHFKQGSTAADAFRRGVEALRIRQFLESQTISGATHPVFVLGDMNEQVGRPQPASFTTTGVGGGYRFPDGSTLPVTFVLGPEVPEVLSYAGFPTSALAALDLEPLAAKQTDGVEERTYHPAGQARLDYILTGSFTHMMGEARAEVYHSGREAVGDGLPKESSLPAPELSAVASDHLVVWAEVALDPRPALVLELPVAPVEVTYEPTLIEGRVRLSSPATQPVTVEITPFRAAPLTPVTHVTVPAGASTAPFSLEVAGSPHTRPRRVTLCARAAGWRDGLGTLTLDTNGVLGEVIISQYSEAVTGTAPKAIEVMNVSGRVLWLAMEPLRVAAFPNGSSSPVQEALVQQGVLPPGAVVVIGDLTTGHYLREQGLLNVTESGLSAAAAGTVFTDNGTLQGRAIFVKDSFTFNGDDALEVQLNFARADVFGQPGVDPGEAWVSSGARPLSTANQNLSRRPEGLSASSGWSDPSLCYQEEPGGSLVGFGVAPPLDDPYAEWAAAQGLTGEEADPFFEVTGNGLTNVMAFLFNGEPRLAWTPSATEDHWLVTLTTEARRKIGRFRWGVEVSDDLRWWRPLNEARSADGAAATTSEAVQWEFSLRAREARYARVFVVRP